MSGFTYRVLNCDAPDCDTEWGSPLPAPTFDALRAWLAARGWTRRGRRDLCPAHSRPAREGL
ncbi:hypothetical protein OG618_18120 [Kitasatospora sp. NBC_01246]|uniref:hypothetical protein n=1 Tax=Kitasatospora sp. NBC_01246 TaxID=2903570 RepID=UPI002E32FA70|nr:hypothetical protein [Kitasatospora sp. NBC_01246]